MLLRTTLSNTRRYANHRSSRLRHQIPGTTIDAMTWKTETKYGDTLYSPSKDELPIQEEWCQTPERLDRS